MKVLKHWCSVVESPVEKATRKLIILSSEEPANVPALVLYSTTALQPSWPFLQRFWTAKGGHSMSRSRYVPQFLGADGVRAAGPQHPRTQPRRICAIQKRSSSFRFENRPQEYRSCIFYCCEIPKRSDGGILH